MKRFSSLLLVAILGGLITLGGYTFFIEKGNHPLVWEEELPVFKTSNTPVSVAANGIDAVDFTTAAENTVNAVVHVKNLTISKAAPSLFDFFYGSEPRQVPQIGTGSGVIISPDGYFETNKQVIYQATYLNVTLIT